MAARVRPFEARDQAGVVALVLGIQRGEFGLPISAAEQPDLLDVLRHYRRGAGNFWVAVDGASVVGSVGLLDIGQGDGALRKMFVARAYRGAARGVATDLLDACREWARAHLLRRILLGTTEEFRAAHRFYDRNGFTAIDLADLPPAFPRMRQDTRYYEYVLEAGRPRRSPLGHRG